MGLLGKAVCGGIGAAIGGPIGAVAGAIMGHYLFDEEETTKKGRPDEPEISDADRRQIAFFYTSIAVLAKIAKADGRVSPEEADLFRDYMVEVNHWDKEVRTLAIKIWNEAKDNDVDALDYVRQLAEILEWDRNMGAIFLDFCMAMSAADGELHAAEMKILLAIERVFRIDGYVESKLRSDAKGNRGGRHPASHEDSALDEAYALLGCSPTMSDEEIKRAYRSKCAEFHPDRIQSKGLAPEFMRFANDHMARINKAYSEIMDHRGGR